MLKISFLLHIHTNKLFYPEVQLVMCLFSKSLRKVAFHLIGVQGEK